MTIGRPPVAGQSYALQDSRWLLGLAGGANRAVQSGFTALSGGGKTGATQLPAAVELIEVDTVAADHNSVLLPSAQPGQFIAVANFGAHILDFYGQGTDTINTAATANAYSINSLTVAIFFCVVKGKWAAIHGS